MAQMGLQINKVLILGKRKISALAKKPLVPKVSAKIMLVKIKARTKGKIKVKTKVRTRALTKALIQAKTKVKSKGKMRQPDLKQIDLILTTKQLVYLKEAKKLAIPLYASLDISKLRSLLSEISPILHRLQDFFKHRVPLIFHPTLCS
jgi:hypothetical protein